MKKVQSAAIPYRLKETDQLSLLLVTSPRKGRWILPKGTVSGMLPHASAAREAFEEAGVIGTIAETSFATYHLQKKSRIWGGDRSSGLRISNAGDGGIINLAGNGFPAEAMGFIETNRRDGGKR